MQEAAQDVLLLGRQRGEDVLLGNPGDVKPPPPPSAETADASVSGVREVSNLPMAGRAMQKLALARGARNEVMVDGFSGQGQDTSAISLRENERGMHTGAGWNPTWHQPIDVFATFSDKDFRLGLNAAQTTLAGVAQLTGARMK